MDEYIKPHFLFTILGDPVGKQRPRIGKQGAYTPKKTRDYEKRVRWCFQDAGGYLLHGAIEIRITAYYPIPKSEPKYMKREMLAGIVRPTKRPDLDNIAKIILDALNGVAYKDDAQVVLVHAEKKYDSCPGVAVTVNEWKGE